MTPVGTNLMASAITRRATDAAAAEAAGTEFLPAR